MSFNVNWDSLETESLINWTKDLLTSALNSGKSPNILASKIQIKDLNFGKIAPNFEILEIGELDSDRFRGIFKINYDGDFHLTLHTNVQANPLNIYYSNSLEHEINQDYQDYQQPFITPSFVLSNEQFALPLDLKLSDIKISGIGIIVFSKSKGLTMVFRNDPLDSIKIENQIRDLFRETLPTLIHQFSLKYLDLDKLNEFASSTVHESHQSHYSQSNEMYNDYENITTSTSTSTATTNNGLQLTNEDESIKTIIYSSKNLQKNLKLFNSRETLALNIPKFKNVIQRSHLDKFNKTYPNLLNSLCSNINDLNVNAIMANPTSASTNGIPIELLVHKNFTKIDHIVEEISNIQTNNYYKLNNEKLSSSTNNSHSNHNNGSGKPTVIKPKRRKIKYNRHSKPLTPTIVATAPSSTSCSLPQSVDISHASSYNSNDLLSETSTLINIDSNINSVPISMTQSTSSTNDDIIIHPKPIRIAHDKLYQEILKSSESEHPLKSHNYETIVVAPPPPSTTSLLSGVGIGNNYFNFTNLNNSQTSPIKQQQSSQSLKEKKSMNYIDINKINDKLRKISLEQKQQREKLMKQHHYDISSNHGLFESPLIVQPPPPYYH